MGIQVSYDMKDLLKHKEAKITFEPEVYYNSNYELIRLWNAFSSNGCYMGQSMTDDLYGIYWFSNKNINFDSVEVLIQYQVPYSRY